MPRLTLVQSFIAARWFRKFSTEPQLRTYQNRLLKKHMALLKRESSYFRDTPLVDSIEDLTLLPIMNKQIMMSHFDAMNTAGVHLKDALSSAIDSEKTRNFTEKHDNISVGLSSGTSGHRGVFIASDKERQMWAGTIMAKMMPPKHYLGQRIALFLRADNNLYQTINSKLIKFQYFDIYNDLKQNLDRLEEYQPTILVAPPSMLMYIALYISQNKITLTKLQKVISAAEVLEPSDERYLKRIFDQKIIYQIYQCTEGFLAFTCSKGSLHLNEEIAIFEREYIDKYRFIPIITDFRRISQPIIRYRLNDVLVSSNKHCSCKLGTSVIKRIEGREDDIFILKNKKGEQIPVFADMISRCMLYASNFNEYRVVQTSYSHFDVFIDSINPKAKQSITAELKGLAKKVGFKSPSIAFKPYKRDMSKKLKRIERTFSI
jgi:putative adenylate-forming enzyme